MTDECRHYSIKDDSDENISYCRDCLLIHIPEKYWHGRIKIGQMTNSFEVTAVDFDFKDMVELNLGVAVELTNVIKSENADRYWEQNYVVWYKIGRAEMFAQVEGLNRSTRYTPTSIYFQPKLEVLSDHLPDQEVLESLSIAEDIGKTAK